MEMYHIWPHHELYPIFGNLFPLMFILNVFVYENEVYSLYGAIVLCPHAMIELLW